MLTGKQAEAAAAALTQARQTEREAEAAKLDDFRAQYAGTWKYRFGGAAVGVLVALVAYFFFHSPMVFVIAPSIGLVIGVFVSRVAQQGAPGDAARAARSRRA